MAGAPTGTGKGQADGSGHGDGAEAAAGEGGERGGGGGAAAAPVLMNHVFPANGRLSLYRYIAESEFSSEELKERIYRASVSSDKLFVPFPTEPIFIEASEAFEAKPGAEYPVLSTKAWSAYVNEVSSGSCRCVQAAPMRADEAFCGASGGNALCAVPAGLNSDADLWCLPGQHASRTQGVVKGATAPLGGLQDGGQGLGCEVPGADPQRDLHLPVRRRGHYKGGGGE